jgi:CRISPR-associated protein Cmr4
MNTRLLLVHALSPVHCGTGQAIGGIDLPIAREKPTGIPLIPGSSVKGVLQAAKPTDEDLHRAVFGPLTENASDNAGSVQFSDANLAFLPVRSLRGTFAWVTSPYILRRLTRDARECGIDLGALPPEPREEKTALVTGDRLTEKDQIQMIFEDLDFTARRDDTLRKLAGALAERLFDEPDRAHFVERSCVVHDDVMSLLLQTSTEITTRIRLDPDKKTVAEGQLWTEEALPVESVLAGLVVATPVKQKKTGLTPKAEVLFDYVTSLAHAGAVQLGGKASVGRGLCRIRLAKKEG